MLVYQPIRVTGLANCHCGGHATALKASDNTATIKCSLCGLSVNQLNIEQARANWDSLQNDLVILSKIRTMKVGSYIYREPAGFVAKINDNLNWSEIIDQAILETEEENECDWQPALDLNITADDGFID